MLSREDARDQVEGIYGTCGGALALASLPEDQAIHAPRIVKTLDAPGNAWCKRLLGTTDGAVAWEQIKKLLDLVDHAEPVGAAYGERAELRAASAAMLADGSLAELVLEHDAIQVAAALGAMQELADTSVIADWSLLERLDASQQNMTWQALWHGLDCQWIGNCSENSLPVSALCNRPNFQCDAGADYFAVVRRSLSAAQFDALMMLMNGVSAYRRQHGG